MDESNESTPPRLLKASWLLRLVMALATILAGYLSIRLIYGQETSLVFMVFFGVLFVALSEPISHLLATHAERKQKPISIWFSPDVVREKRRMGPLRAHRKLGHPIGRRKR